MTKKLEAARLNQDSTPLDPRTIQKALKELEGGAKRLAKTHWIQSWGRDANATCAMGSLRWKTGNQYTDNYDYGVELNTPNSPLGLAARALAANVPGSGCPRGYGLIHRQHYAASTVIAFNDAKGRQKADIEELFQKAKRTLEMELEK